MKSNQRVMLSDAFAVERDMVARLSSLRKLFASLRTAAIVAEVKVFVARAQQTAVRWGVAAICPFVVACLN